MPGSAQLGTGLVDEMVPIVDELRANLAPVFGHVQFRTFVVKRSWPVKTKRGDASAGPPVFLVQNEITPVPRFTWADLSNPLHRALFPTGLDEEGNAVLTDVSLTYLESELVLTGLHPWEDFYYRIVEGQSQQIANRYFVPAGPARPDRTKTIGWIIPLRRAVVVE
jgi:hypothetical protein